LTVGKENIRATALALHWKTSTPVEVFGCR
jgi:hypothetical protein